MNIILDLADSELICHSYLPKQQILNISINTWNGKNMYISFYETIAYCFMSFSNPTCMRIADSNSEFLVRALQAEYEKIPSDHGYTCYELLDQDDAPYFSIVAKCYKYKSATSVQEF
ncbi:MAG: hypothetical protein LBU65_17070 [Planctomycetaceae bacterium]|jgi:hypothetical protein|nr:hypothetical protein [Planctomycetaceae bacterium]